jgi:ribonuclease VapC
MFIDASAIVAILLDEPEAAAFAALIDKATTPVTGPIAMFEACLAVSRARRIEPEEATALVETFIGARGMPLAPITIKTSRLALAAYVRFGKGRHKAALNLGDCFAYAQARELKLPLLFKGEDFTETDIPVALFQSADAAPTKKE